MEELLKDTAKLQLELNRLRAENKSLSDLYEKKIEEVRNANEVLLRNQALLNDMGQMAKVGGWEIDVLQQRVLWTDEVYRIYEVDSNYNPTLSFGVQFYSEESKPILNRSIQRAVKLGEPFDVELEIKTAKGNLKTVHVIGKANFSYGRIASVSGTYQDITEKRKTQSSLNESLKKYRLISEKSTDVVWLMDLTGKSIYVSPSVYLFSGYTPEEYLKLSILDRFAEESGKIAYNLFTEETKKYVGKSIVSKDYFRRLELEYLCKDGSTKWGEVMVTPYFDEDGFLQGVHGVTRDISEKRQAEKAMLEAKEQMETVFNTSPDSVVITKIPDGTFVAVNDSFTQISGYSREEVLGKTSSEVNLYSNLEDRRKIIEEVMTKGYCHNYEAIFNCKDGGLITGIMSVKLFHLNGNPHMLSVTRDISDRKSSDEKLRASEEKYRMIADNSTDKIWMLDFATQKFIYISPSVERILGYTPDEVYNMTLTDFLLPEDVPNIMTRIQEAIMIESSNPETRIVHEFAFKEVRKDGQIIDTEGQVQFIRDKNGLPIIVQGITRDVTARNQREKELKESKENFELIFDSTPDIMAIYSIEKDCFVDVNLEFCRVVGYSRDEIIGRSGNEFNFFKDSNESKAYVKELLERRTVKNREISFLTPGGKYIVGILSSRIINLQGIPHVLSVFKDISERKESELIIQEKNIQLHDLIATKDKFFSIIAHDLKNPFNGILGLSNMSQLYLDRGEYGKLKEFVSLISNSAQQAHRLLENLLEWASIQTGKLQADLKNNNIKDILQDAISINEEHMRNKNITLIDNVDSCIVFCDKDMTTTIIRNLISNAVKFTKIDGMITLSTQKKGSFVVFQITDNGVGMTPEKVANLFKLDKTNTTHGTSMEIGSGLGLILCKELVEKQNGTIWVESEVDQGSSFSFTLQKEILN